MAARAMPDNLLQAYFCGMKAPGRALVLDLSLALIGVVLTAVAVWSVNVIATPFAGPTWLKVIWPLLIGAPLALRRRAPLAGWTIIWAGISLQALITGNSPEGLELMFVLAVGSYSVGAHTTLRRALAGLAVTAAGAIIYGQANHDIMSGNTGNEWSAAFFATAILAAWLAGVFVRGRREAVVQAARTAAAERQAERAVADERARMARELHDIVSHNLSVVVLQAAGSSRRRLGHRPDPGENRAQRPPGASGDAQAAGRAAPAGRAQPGLSCLRSPVWPGWRRWRRASAQPGCPWCWSSTATLTGCPRRWISRPTGLCRKP